MTLAHVSKDNVVREFGSCDIPREPCFWAQSGETHRTKGSNSSFPKAQEFEIVKVCLLLFSFFLVSPHVNAH